MGSGFPPTATAERAVAQRTGRSEKTFPAPRLVACSARRRPFTVGMTTPSLVKRRPSSRHRVEADRCAGLERDPAPSGHLRPPGAQLLSAVATARPTEGVAGRRVRPPWWPGSCSAAGSPPPRPGNGSRLPPSCRPFQDRRRVVPGKAVARPLRPLVEVKAQEKPPETGRAWPKGQPPSRPSRSVSLRKDGAQPIRRSDRPAPLHARRSSLR